MFIYNIHLKWERETEDFNYNTYNRKHTVFFNGGPKIVINTSRHFIRNPQFHCPEELLVASLCSCFLLTFLSLCAEEGYVINSYLDEGHCHLDEKNQIISDIILTPVVLFEDTKKPDEKTMHELFEKAHSRCFIANSLKTVISVNPRFADIPS